MAIEDMFDRIIAMAVRVARRNAIMPRMVNTSLGSELSIQGGTANITVIDTPRSSIPIVPGPVPPASQRPQPRNVALSLNYWEDATFNLTDRDISSMANDNDYLPKELEASAAGIADRVDSTILSNYRGVYGIVGTPGTTPFATSTLEAQDATRVLSTQRAPKGNGTRRSIVLNEFAYANAIGLSALQRVDASGSNITLREAQVGRALGFEWEEDQNVPVHTTTGGAGFLTNGAQPAGAAVLQVKTGTVAPAFGDIFTIAGQNQTYVVLSGSTTSFSISPNLQVAVPDNASITFRASHAVNLAFTDQAFAFASRPMQAQALPGFAMVRTWVDDVSGLVLTLEVAREYYQTAFRLSCLWGTELVQPRFATRIAG